MSEATGEVPLKDAARQKYLNYALSVITSRALPDVRDGMKPVQRRILYAMYQDLKLLPERKQLKCAKVVGEVLGNYHPHGDSAVYEALVRMSQDFSLRAPLVNGHGNFGSIDGDRAAAYRYTEAKLRPVALTLLEEIGQDTVNFRDTFDGMRQEPVVLPSQGPTLLLNGATGIAVGIATNIPPHNLGEIVKAAVKLVEKPTATVGELTRHVKGPDFPTGAQILNSKAEIRAIYETGGGPVKIRGEYKLEKSGRKQSVVIHSIPYMIKKQDLVGKIRDLAYDKKIPQILDVRDESTDDIRVVLDLKAGSDVDKVMAYLFKSTDLQTNFHVNLTCLVPLEGTDIAAPMKLDLAGMLRYFLDFRFDVVRRRFEFELRKLMERIHILEGFKKIFDDLDTAIQIIRDSKGKKDAAEGLIEYFMIDDIQANAILELMLYRLASLEIRKILEELREKKARAKEIRTILASDKKLWDIVKSELEALSKTHGNKRRTTVLDISDADTVEISDDDFIVEEDQFVTLSTGGWLKRVGSIKSADKVMVKKGDELVGIVAGSTKHCVVFFSNKGVAYTARIHDIPASRGYGDPIQKLFRFKDGERVIAMMSLDPRAIGDVNPHKNPDYCPPVHGLAVTSTGYGLRFGLSTFAEPSTRAGRKFARVTGDAEVVKVLSITGEETLICVSEQARGLLCAASEVNFLEGPGKGVYVLKVAAGDRVVGVTATLEDHKGLTAVTNNDATHNINARRYKITSRAGKGFQIIKRGKIVDIKQADITVPDLGGKS